MLTKQAIEKKLNSSAIPSILIVGDVMLDHYIEGSADRLSPEAPVAVINVTNEKYIPGGASNVAVNLIALGAKASIAGCTGNDEAAKRIVDLAASQSVYTNLLIQDDTRPTTVKSRVVTGNHQLVRFDRESAAALNEELSSLLCSKIESCINDFDIVLLSDYNKGVLHANNTEKIISIANKANKKVIVDPKGLQYSKYANAFIIKPNRKELKEATHTEKALRLKNEIHEAASKVIALTHAQYIVTTLSQDGVALTSNDNTTVFPVQANEVYDVTGAGDTVLASLGFFLSKGFSVEESCELANHAAAIVVKKAGNATASIQEIINNYTSV